MILVIDEKGKPCKRGHGGKLNHLIQGTKKRFCTHVMENTIEMTEGTIKVKMCGEVK